MVDSYLKYSTVSGFFQQDDAKTDPTNFDFTKSNFGLIDQAYDTDTSLSSTIVDPTQWQRFEHKLATMNREAPADTSYKLLFLGRHGQGYHNVAESFYGGKAWDCKYSLLPGNATSTWVDAHLTPLGITQALTANAFWASCIATQRTPTPQLFLSSPMDRAMHTAHLTFSTLKLPADRPFRGSVLVKEGLRECIGIHTCDKRSTKSEIQLRWPPPPDGDFEFEAGFVEHDELWLPDLRETAPAQTARLMRLLDDVFEHEARDRGVQVVSMTSHSGTMAAILRAVGHREFAVQTGGVIPILVKVARLEGKRPEEKFEQWEGLPEECKTFKDATERKL